MRTNPIAIEISEIQILLQSGRFSQAFNRSTKAAKKWPKVAAFPRLSGISAANQNRQTVAKTHFKRAWRMAPTQPEYVQNYGLSLLQCNEPDTVLEIVKKAEQSGALPCILLQLRAMAQFQNRDDSGALTSLEQSLLLDPNFLESKILLIDVLQQLRRNDEALQTARDLAQRHPKLAIAHLRLAKMLVAVGDFKSALTHAKLASELNPSHGETLRFWAELPELPASHRDQILAQIASNLNNASANNADRAMTHFGAASIARSAGNLGDEMRHLLKGHEIVAESHQDPEPKANRLLKQRLAESPVQSPSIGDTAKPTPIFVIGLPRSGTTLVDQIVSAHSSVFSMGELISVMQWVDKFEASTPQPQHATHFESFYRRSLQNVPKTAAAVVDKMPGNYAHIGLIARAFPTSPILNGCRDPRDVALSIWRQAFMAEGMAYAHRLEWIAAESNRYQTYMQNWHKLLPGRIYDVQYEQLVTDPGNEVLRIAEHCGLCFEEAMLQPHRNLNPVQTASQIQVRRPINTSSIGGWRKAETWLQPFICRLDMGLWGHLGQ